MEKSNLKNENGFFNTKNCKIDSFGNRTVKLDEETYVEVGYNRFYNIKALHKATNDYFKKIDKSITFIREANHPISYSK